ncbi:CoA-transferase family III [Ceratobasidium sp. AG-I]|nr:CoA-transferase family III [Ceratobasidium sp. AG-I]
MPPKTFETTKQVIDRLWSTPTLGLPARATGRLALTGRAEPIVPSSFRIGAVAQASIACSALSSAYIHQLRNGVAELQGVTVDSRHAVLDFKSEQWTTLNGEPAGDIWDALAGVYETKDGHVRIHTNFPHHRDAVLTTLSLATRPVPSRDAVAAAFREWSTQDFEDAVTKAGGCASKIRSFAEWDAHPHAIHSKDLPPVSLNKVGESEARSLPKIQSADLPLKGVRVLDLTRVIAGPVCGRTLAAHGADVLWITSPNLPDLPALDIDTSRGKRTAQLDLNLPSDGEKFQNLLKDADVLLQSYRPGSLARRGFGPEQLAKDYPRLVTASLSAYGVDGPWGGKRGFDSLVQAATGFNTSEAESFNSAHHQSRSSAPTSSVRALPCQALDHAAGHVLALGINAALGRRIKEGGSWDIQVSLLGVANWVRSLGQFEPEVAFSEESMANGIPPKAVPVASEVEELLVNVPIEGDGQRLRALRHAAVMAETPVRVGRAPGGLNAHQPEWLPRE